METQALANVESTIPPPVFYVHKNAAYTIVFSSRPAFDLCLQPRELYLCSRGYLIFSSSIRSYGWEATSTRAYALLACSSWPIAVPWKLSAQRKRHCSNEPLASIGSQLGNLILLSVELGALSLSLCVDFASEWVLESQSDQVDNQNLNSKENTSWLPEPQSRSEERHSRPVVHWRLGNVEWETSNNIIHQNAKVVAQIRAGNTKCPHRGDNQDVSRDEEEDGGVLDKIGLESWVGWLVAESDLIEVVAEDAQGEDGHGEHIAAIARVSTGELGEDAVVVFWYALGYVRVEGCGRRGLWLWTLTGDGAGKWLTENC